MQLSTLQDVYGHPGPYVTIHVDVSRNTEDAAQQLDARWTRIRHDLEHGAVDPALLEEIGKRLHEPVDLPGEARRTLVAAGDRVLFDEVLAGSSVWPETVTVGDLPDVAPWAHQADGQLPFLLVVADREGADLDFYPTRAQPSADATVQGSDLHLHKYQGGGWSHRRFQQRSENQWESNAREVADEIRDLVKRHRPRVVLLAGDERARTSIAGALDGIQAEVEQVGAGGRAAGASDDALWAEVDRVLAAYEAADQVETIGSLEEKWGQGRGAALGVDDVMQALVQHQVDTLIVDLQKAHELTVDPSRYPGLPIPEQAATKKELPADQVLVAAAAATDTHLAVLPAAQTKGGGVAAILRWDGRAADEQP